MILVTRLNKSKIVVNADRIKTVEATPDTVITLGNDEKLLVSEPVDEIIAKVIEYRRKIFKALLSLDPGSVREAMSEKANQDY